MDKPVWKPRRKKALTYLRVSTPKQVKREFDPEGISLPDQRRAVKAKADSLDADIVEEFPEKGCPRGRWISGRSFNGCSPTSKNTATSTT